MAHPPFPPKDLTGTIYHTKQYEVQLTKTEALWLRNLVMKAIADHYEEYTTREVVKEDEALARAYVNEVKFMSQITTALDAVLD